MARHRRGVANCAHRDAIRKAMPNSFPYPSAMSVYQLRYFDVFIGHVACVREFESETDQAAIIYADDARGLAPMELWQGDRLLKRWPAFPASE
jgi:hypothetical protein